jgi:DNA polymerase
MNSVVQDILADELEKRDALLRKIRDDLVADKNAPLYEYRKSQGFHPVIGEGNHAAQIMFVGEAPGENEAKQGRPFCGSAGKFLDVLLEHIGLARKDVYITNLVKDRPPENRDPLPVEIEYYAKLLDLQVEIMRPSCLVTLGRFSMGYLLPKLGLSNELKSISQIHGKTFEGTYNGENVSVVTLYHPAVALYNGGMRGTLLKDAEVLKQFIGQ